MLNNIYSTADIYASALLPFVPTASTGNYTAPGLANQSPTYPPSNLFDGSSTTVADIDGETGGLNPNYIIINLGQPQVITQIVLQRVTYSEIITVTASNTLFNNATSTPIGTVIPFNGTEPATETNATMTFIPTGGTIVAQYLYIYLNSMFGSATIGQAVIYAQVKFGAIQNLSITDMAEVRKDLFTAAGVSVRAVDTFDHQMKFEISAESCDFNLEMLPLLTLVPSLTSSETLASILNIGQLPFFSVSGTLTATNGHTFTFAAQNVKADGLSLKTSVADWAKNAVKFCGYPQYGLVWSLTQV